VAMAWVAPMVYTFPNNLGTIWALIILPYVLFTLYLKTRSWMSDRLARRGGGRGLPAFDHSVNEKKG
ncbi:MAG TPA: hypothetical protein VK187_13345, partial [Geobacteraceae bacterium]|nr:hypothetical protein [Geobacteraceae bacterium]